LLVKMSISGPPVVPTSKVPPPPCPVIDTPLTTPVGLKGVGVAPLMTCCAKLPEDQAAIAATDDRSKSLYFTE